MHSTSPALTYTVRQSVAEILLNCPPVNAITEAMMDQLLQHLADAARDPAVKAVILGSAVPGRFCAGLHLSEMGNADFEHKLALVEKLYSGLFEAQTRLGKPSIAAVSGTARGGGMTLAVSCDMLIASDTASFGYPEIDVGVTPAIHYTHLPRIIGKHRAFELLFTGRSFSAAEALQLGLINQVVPEAQVLERARHRTAVLPKIPAGHEAGPPGLPQGHRCRVPPGRGVGRGALRQCRGHRRCA